MATARPKKFIPKNPDKYHGDINNITARSSWELLYMTALDNSPLVAKWISEPKFLNIQYQSPVDKKVKQYWPDFFVLYTSGEKELIEIKPLKEALLEKAKTQYDKLMLANNMMKWKAASIFAKTIGARFRVVTEAQLFVNKNKTAKRPSTTKKTRGTLGTVKSRGTKK